MSSYIISAFDSSTVIYGGYMVKSPPLDGIRRTIKRWRKRYFVLRPNKVLEYFDSPSKKVLKGAVDLRECINLQFGVFHKKRSNVIVLTTVRRKFFFQANSEVEMLYWTECIRLVKNAHEGDTVALPKLFHYKDGQEEELTEEGIQHDLVEARHDDSSQESSPSPSYSPPLPDQRQKHHKLKAFLQGTKRQVFRRRSELPQTSHQVHKITVSPPIHHPLDQELNSFDFQFEDRHEEVKKSIRRKFQESLRHRKKDTISRNRLPSDQSLQSEFDFFTGEEIDDILDGYDRGTSSQENITETNTAGELKSTREKIHDDQPIRTHHSMENLSSVSESEDEPSSNLYRSKSSENILGQSDSGYEDGPNLRFQIYPATTPQQPTREKDSSFERLKFYGDVPSTVDYTHYAAYPFSYSGGTLTPGNSEISLHIPPGAISPYESLFFPELASSSMWRPLVVVNAKSSDNPNELPVFTPTTPLLKLTPARELASNVQPSTFYHPVIIRLPHSILYYDQLHNAEAEFAILVAKAKGGIFSESESTSRQEIEFSVYPVDVANPSDMGEVRDILRKKKLAVALSQSHYLMFAKELSTSLFIIGGLVHKENFNVSQDSYLHSRIYRELLPIKSFVLKIFTKYSPQSNQHCVVAYLVENYSDAKKTIEAMCYKQEFTSCLKTKEERLLELPMDANIPILATIGKTKEQGYNFGTLEQSMMECDGCWKAAVFYIQISYKKNTTLPRGGMLGLSLSIHSPKQVFLEKKFNIMLKRLKL